MATTVRNRSEKRFYNEGQEVGDPIASWPRPLSLIADDTLIWLNAIGNNEAREITEQWRPAFRVVTVHELQERGWQ